MCLTSSFIRLVGLVISSDFTNTQFKLSFQAQETPHSVILKCFLRPWNCLPLIVSVHFPPLRRRNGTAPRLRCLIEFACVWFLVVRKRNISEPHADLQAHCDYIMFSLAGCTDSVDGTLPPNEWGCSPSGPLWPSVRCFIILLSILITHFNR